MFKCMIPFHLKYSTVGFPMNDWVNPNLTRKRKKKRSRFESGIIRVNLTQIWSTKKLEPMRFDSTCSSGRVRPESGYGTRWRAVIRFRFEARLLLKTLSGFTIISRRKRAEQKQNGRIYKFDTCDLWSQVSVYPCVPLIGNRLTWLVFVWQGKKNNYRQKKKYAYQNFLRLPQ